MPKWKHNVDVLMREEDDGKYLAFNSSTGVVLILNATAHFIWSHAVLGLNAQEIAQAVKKEFRFVEPEPSADQLLEIVSSHLVLLQRAALLLGEEAKIDARVVEHAGGAV